MSFGLIINNPQLDFLPGGSIDVPFATTAITNIATLCRTADLVVVSRDYHPSNHFSFTETPAYEDGSWPPHCVQGTRGARVFAPIRKHADYILSKATNPNPPDIYSAFYAKKLRPVEDLVDILKRHPVDDLVICGMLFEIDVAFTAYDANAIGHWDSVTIPLNCCGTLLDNDHLNSVIQPMKNAGIQVVDTL